VQLRDLFITPQGLAFVDLSQELISNHPGGTCAEELTVYSLANTLVANFPAVKGVQILVEGREIQSLAGHLDLSKPYGRGPQRLEQS
jgi:spore germination protein GerM